MSTLNFPTSPSLNDTYSFGTKTWVWNGEAWDLQSAGAINDIPIGNVTPASGAFTTVTANSTISAVGNITGSYFVGNGSQLTGLPEGYGNANVEAYLPTYTGNLVSLTGAVTTTANITGGNVLTGGLITATGNVTGGNLITAGLASLSVIVKTGTDGVGNIGAVGSTFNTVFAKATSAQYADVAEQYQADADYPLGTVLIIGGAQEVTASTHSHDTAVAGVVSQRPSYLMNAGLQTANSVPVALLGRVPCQVVGTITRGQLLVTSSTPGTATSLDHTKYVPGCVIGKALEDYNSNVAGIIEIAVGIK